MGSKITIGGELAFPSDYLAAVEFKGREVTLTIKSVALEDLVMVGGGKKRKPVLTFNGTKKKLVLNVTNSNAIASMYGSEAKAWVGKNVTFYPTKAKFGRNMVDAIRVKVGKQQQQKPAAPEDEFDAADKQRFVDELRSRAAEFPDQLEFVLGEIEQNKDWLGEAAVTKLRAELGPGKVG